MRVRRLAPVVLLAACSRAAVEAPAPDLRPEPYDSPVTVHRSRPEPPPMVLGYEQIEHELVDINLGSRTRYRDSSGVQLDIFVYPIPWPDALCPRECAVQWVTDEADQFAEAGAAAVVQKGYVRSMKLQSDSTLSFPHQGVSKGRHLVFQVTNDESRNGRSDFLVVAAFGYRIKLRLSDFEGRVDSATAVTFFGALLHGFQPPYVCQLGVAEQAAGPTIETVVASTAEQLAGVVDTLIQRRDWELKYARGGLWTTVPQFDWPLETEDQTWHGSVHPGYQAMIGIRERGDSTAFSIVAPTVCDIGDHALVDGKPFTTTLQMAVAGGFAADLSKQLDSLTARR